MQYLRFFQRLFLSFMFFACFPVFSAQAKNQTVPVVMGYWENWGTYANFPMPNNAQNSTNPDLLGQLSGLTTLSYAFLEVANDGSILFSDPWSDLNSNNAEDKQFCSEFPQSCGNFPAGLGNFKAFSAATIAHRAISIGGASHDDAWENAMNHPDQFLKTLKALSAIYHIDWLDVDYEPMPSMPEKNIKPFINLMIKIHEAMPNLIISYTIPPNQMSIQSFGVDNWQLLNRNINYVNIMGYDMHGAFDKANPYTALQSALMANSDNEFSDDNAFKALNAVGIDNSKIILGMPMYGRAVGGVTTSGLNQLFTSSVKGDLDDPNCSIVLGAGNMCSGNVKYKTLVDRQLQAIPVKINGKLSGVYAYDAAAQQFISYDNPESAAEKAKYALDHQMGGVMFWALKDDKPVNHAQSILAAVDKIFGITPHQPPDNTPKMKLQLTNNDPKNPVTISLVTADKSAYYPFPVLSSAGQSGSDVVYTDINSSTVKTLMNQSSILVLLTNAANQQTLCRGQLNFTTGSYHHIQVYYDYPTPNCAIN